MTAISEETTLAPRIDYAHVGPNALRAQFGLETYVRGSGLETSLVHLIKLRASYLNGCAYCVDMHSKDARHIGGPEEKLSLVCVWREAPHFSERERAAFEWTEAVTFIAQSQVPDSVYRIAREQFTEQELVNLTIAVSMINTWNRLCISFRKPAGTYQVPQSKPAAVRS